MGGSKSQTVGYKYFAGLMVVIGNRIEKLLDINPAEKGWIVSDERPSENDSMFIHYPDLFGGDKKEGGWVGFIDTHLGANDQKQNKYLAQHIGEDVSAFPNLSYLVFRGADVLGNHYQENTNKGFQFVSMSGMMKEFLLWVKRTRIKNDGSRQWFEYSYRENKKIIVCEIGGRVVTEKSPDFDGGPFDANLKAFNHDIYNGSDNEYIGADHNIRFIDYNFEFIFNNVVSGTLYSQYLTPPTDVNISQRVEFNGFGKGYVIAHFKISAYGKREISFFGNMISMLSENIVEQDGNNPAIIEYSVLFSSNQKFGVNIKTTEYHRNGDNYFFSNACLTILSKPFEEANYFKESPAPDINPIHKIREILTDYTAMGKPESDVNDQNFRAMADRIYDEGLGISWCIQQKSCKEALEELEYHIEGGVRINRQTGLYEVILFRDDLLELDDALHFDESNIKSFQPDIINAEDQINAVNVSFYDRENIKDSSFSLSDVGSFHTIDHENADDLKFPYFMNRRNAEMVANWKLKQLSTMAWKGTFTTGKYEARKINKYDVVLLSWKSKNIVNLPVRVMNINLGNGRDNTVTLDFVEVVPYSNISYSSINVDPNPNPILPPQPNSSIVFEMPYFEAVQRMGQTSVDAELANNPEIGYLMAAAIKPQNNSLNALLYTDGGTGVYTNFEEVGVVEYCAACYLDQQIGFTETSFRIIDTDSVQYNKVPKFSGVKAGTWFYLNDEILVFQSFDAETKIITVKRGALDTIPQKHTAGALYFCDESSGLDVTTYVDGETVKAQVLTTTPSGIEKLDLGNVQSLDIAGRANRPYPPANIKLNGIYYPEVILATSDITVTWVDRNRIQQTGGSLLGFYDEGVTRESNVTYSLELLSENIVLYSQENLSTNSHSISSSVLIPNKAHKLKLWSVRDSFESYQIFEHNFFVEAVSLILTAAVSKDKVAGSTVPAANINVAVDETLTANMKFDGSSIKGKTLPNANITIEVDD